MRRASSSIAPSNAGANYLFQGQMISYWDIALMLLTLFRVATFAISRRKYYLCNDDAHKEDIISQLPDHILVLIIARTPIEVAVRTSILSKRWRNLYKSVSNINLCCSDLLPGCSEAPHYSDSGVIVYRLERFLRHYSGYKIRYFCLSCCLTESNAERCINCLGKLDVEKVSIWLPCFWNPGGLSFSCHLISKIPSLKHFVLGLCTLKPDLKSQWNSSSFLQTLQLRAVAIAPGSVECILSNCLSLHSLYIARCHCPSKLGFCGPNLQLKTLMLDNCQGLKEIEIHAINLLRLELHNDEMINFIFDHVPQLQTLYLAPEKSKNIMSHVFGILTKDLPHLKSLTFDTRGDFEQESRRLMGMGIETFSYLRRLSLNLYNTPTTNLLALIPFLQSCPLLQEFHLDTRSLRYCGGGGKQREDAVLVHPELKRVEISGFDGTENEIEFFTYVLRSAVRLEQMVIGRCAKYYIGYRRWNTISRYPVWSEETYKMIQKRLQDEALSETAQVIVRYASISLWSDD